MTRSTPGRTASSGRSTADQAKEQVRSTARTAQDKASGTLDQARARLREQVGQRSAQAGDQITAAAKDVRGVGDQLRGQGREWPARVADELADRVESFGGYLRGSDGERLLRDVESFARRQPWAMVAGGLTLGFALSRFMKASSGRRYQAGSDWQYDDERYRGATVPDQRIQAPSTSAHDVPRGADTAGLTPGGSYDDPTLR